ncbi:MAG: hypothetical protein GY851_27660, partial [bacterium]|nr:hypothetical protein [bacterium]
MRNRICMAVASVLLALAVIGTALGAPTTVHVATNGNDAWSGTLAQPNAEKTDGPLATLGHARDVARKTRPARIVLHEGVHVLSKAVELGPQDSGLTVEGVKGKDVVISGGRRIVGWKPWKGSILQ